MYAFMKLSKPQRRINTKKTTPKYIIGKLLKTKNKEKILKAVREKWHTAYIVIIQMIAPFTSF